MKLILEKTTFDRSLQRCWNLTDAEPVKAFLPPYTEFVPADLRIWWSTEEGDSTEPDSTSIYAWPEDRDTNLSAHWRNGPSYSPLPEWIRNLSDTVHEDLIANAASSHTGAEDCWSYSADSRWTIEEGSPVPSLRYPHEPFVPGDLSIWHSYSPSQMYQNRHTVRAFPADREQRLKLSGHWDGGINWDGTPRYDAELPAWIRELAEAQYAELVALATRRELERGAR
jgi:hypothetical protein